MDGGSGRREFKKEMGRCLSLLGFRRVGERVAGIASYSWIERKLQTKGLYNSTRRTLKMFCYSCYYGYVGTVIALASKRVTFYCCLSLTITLVGLDVPSRV